MKNAISILCSALIFMSCEQKKNLMQNANDLTIAEKIANAHGFENWNQVKEISFTFEIQRDSTSYNRSWQWNPKTNNVVMMTSKDTVSYNRTRIDSTSLGADRRFINDKYWLLIPFQLIWDEGTTISESVIENAPISSVEMNKITLTYSNEGGYTPGDAYDIYYDTNFMIREWVFREGNSTKPSMTTTFENYQDYNGIKLAQEHKKPTGNWQLNFKDIEVILD